MSKRLALMLPIVAAVGLPPDLAPNPHYRQYRPAPPTKKPPKGTKPRVKRWRIRKGGGA